MSLLAINKLRRLTLGFPKLNAAFPGFELGDFAVLHGNAASYISFVLAVRAQFPLGQGGLGSSIAFVDGGNMFDPYSVAELARGYNLNPRTVLGEIHVSRAFTAYQLSSLVLEKLNLVLKRNKFGLLIVSDIASLFLDRDIPDAEGKEFFMKVCAKLSEMADKKETIVVASYSMERNLQGLFFEAILFEKCNVLIRVKKVGRILTFALEDHSRIKPFNMDFTVDNCSLDSFMET